MQFGNGVVFGFGFDHSFLETKLMDYNCYTTILYYILVKFLSWSSNTTRITRKTQSVGSVGHMFFFFLQVERF